MDTKYIYGEDLSDRTRDAIKLNPYEPDRELNFVLLGVKLMKESEGYLITGGDNFKALFNK